LNHETGNFPAQVPSKVMAMRYRISESAWGGSIAFLIWPRCLWDHDYGPLSSHSILASMMSLVGINNHVRSIKVIYVLN
jgi:hypothetical protein